MGLEIYKLYKDVSAYVSQISQRRQLRKSSEEGFDYTGDEYRNLVRSVVERLHPASMRLKVDKIIQQTPSTKTFRFCRIDGKFPPFRAGQYITLYLEIDGVSTARAYSISSVSGELHIDLTIRYKEGGFVSVYMHKKCREGDEFDSSGPAGQFYYESLIDKKELVFIAGGSGITPFMSILKTFEKQGWPQKVHMLYGNRHLNDVIFEKELNRLSADNPNFNYALVVSEPGDDYRGVRGFITADLVKNHVGDPAGKTFMICGPNAMYDFVSQALKTLQVPGRRIRREIYGPPEQVMGEKGWPAGVDAEQVFSVEVVGHKTIQVKAGEPIINSLERNGLKVRSLCRAGECSYCRIKVLEGEVFMPDGNGVREMDKRDGYVHSCVAYPLKDLKIEI